MFSMRVVLLIAGICSVSALQCSILNLVLSGLPVNLIKPLHNLGTECSLESCGQVGGLGYFDVYCNYQCMLAGFGAGTCTRDLAQGWAKCACSGGASVSLPQSTPTVCALIGACACKTCNNGASPPVKYIGGNCFHNPPNTVGVQCTLPLPHSLPQGTVE